MAKSRNRGGAKAHRKRVQKRNQKLGLIKEQFQKKYTQLMEEKLKEFEAKYSGSNELPSAESIVELIDEVQSENKSSENQ